LVDLERQSGAPAGWFEASYILPGLDFLVRMVGGSYPLPFVRDPHRLVSHEPWIQQRCGRSNHDDTGLSGLWFQSFI
jgi:hypothetical protein